MPLSENDLVVLTSRLLECDELTVQEKIVFAKIAMFKKYGCYATNNYFGKILNVSTKRAGVVICSLVDKGYIKRTLNTVDNNSKRSLTVTKNIQKILLDIPHPDYIPPPSKQGDPHPISGVPPHPISGVLNKDKYNKDINKDVIPIEEQASEGQYTISACFENLWNKYPKERRSNKSNLLVRYRKIVKKDPNMIDKLNQAIDDWLNSDQWYNGYIHNINKWFKEEIYLITPMQKRDNDPWRSV